MQITEKELKWLKPYANNPRDNASAVEPVAKSIKEFGFKVPIVATSDGEIINGHTRFKASKLLGLEIVPVIIADDLTDEQIKAFRLVDNKTGELADWNEELLAKELEKLDFNLEQFGFEKLADDFYEEEEEDPYTSKITTTDIMLNQLQTQSNAGGMIDLYLDGGTYLKSFYTVLFMPSAVTVQPMGTSHKRLHHNVDWERCVPKILSEELKQT